MAISQSVVTLGTGVQQVLPPSTDAQRVTIKNLQPASRAGEYSREGYAFEMSRKFAIASPGTASFSIETPASGVQFVSYEIISDNATVTASLIEGATVTSAGSPIATFNLNRQSARTASAVFDSATVITGGTVIATEYVTAAHKSAGSADSDKVFTLKASQKYVMRFVNDGNQETNVFFSLVFTEQFNGSHSVWLGAADASYHLLGGEEVQLFMEAGESIAARAGGTACRIAVIRQD